MARPAPGAVVSRGRRRRRGQRGLRLRRPPRYRVERGDLGRVAHHGLDVCADGERVDGLEREAEVEERNRIYAEAYQRSPEFYSFYRSMEAYRNTFRGRNDLMLLETNSDFLRYFRDSLGRQASPKK